MLTIARAGSDLPDHPAQPASVTLRARRPRRFPHLHRDSPVVVVSAAVCQQQLQLAGSGKGLMIVPQTTLPEGRV